MDNDQAVPYVVRAGRGEGIWFLSTLLTVKAGTEAAEGAFTFLEQWCPPGFAPPQHVHHAETEAFYMLAGSMTVACGSVHTDVGPGDFMLLPRGIPHGFTVPESAPARFIHLTAPGQFDHFAREVGQPASALVLPQVEEPDMDEFVATANRYQLGIFGPDGRPMPVRSPATAAPTPTTDAR
jgi:mannose-6-phosphate isomerase-like protein (cupin superfamily)